MKKIFLFTHSYPYARMGEAFIEVELKVASTLDIDLTIIPIYSSDFKKDIPSNVKINNKLNKLGFLRKSKVFFSMLVNPLFFGLFFRNIEIYRRPTNWYYAFKYLYGGLLISDFLTSNISDFPEGSVLYSFWLNYTVLGFALAKANNNHFKNCKFYSRVNGYDLYAEEIGIFMPYREKMLASLDKVFPVSAMGAKLLSERYPDFSSIIEVSRLGTFPIQSIKEKKTGTDLSLISCSSVIPLKRVSLIFKSVNDFCIRNSHLRVKWIHIGDGSEMNNLKDSVDKEKADNLNVELLGTRLNSDIIELLSTNVFDAFVNLSTREGIPVTLMEAISAGIPLIATDAGGNNEIVTKETGCLIPMNFTDYEFSEAVKHCMNNEKLRESALLFYQENFSALKNYKNFYEKL